MKKPIQKWPMPVESTHYDCDYFLSKCGGADWFQRSVQTSASGEMYPLYEKIVSRLDPKPSQLAIDVGCGRGEIGALLALKGLTVIGLDYSPAALQLASEIRKSLGALSSGSFYLVRGEAESLPFLDDSFHYIVLADIVEHLHEWQLDALYSECRRLLNPGGRVIIHTWPNHWHTLYTYPIFSRLSRLLGISRPLDHRKPHDMVVHVNEQSILSIKRSLRIAGFMIERSWCEHDCVFSWNPWWLVYWLFHCTPGLRLFFADHLWVLAKKRGNNNGIDPETEYYDSYQRIYGL